MKANALWKCPRCGREFRRRDQWHSCVSVSVDEHFKSKPAKLKKIFNRILQELRKSGPLRVDAVKSSINLAGKSHFGMITVLDDSLNVGFMLNRKIENPRIKRVGKITETSYEHIVELRKVSDVDAELLNWLKEAYALRGLSA